MPAATIAIGLLLIVLGVGGYVLTDRASVTALIPAMFGVVLAALGMLAHRPALRKHMMHAAAGLALLGVIGAASGVVATVRAIAGHSIENRTANYCRSLMVLLCLLLLVLCVRSFILARRERAGTEN